VRGRRRGQTPTTAALQPGKHFGPFDKAIAKMRREPVLIDSSHRVMYALLWALNEVLRARSSIVLVTCSRRPMTTFFGDHEVRSPHRQVGDAPTGAS
jgi:hypothetical protein